MQITKVVAAAERERSAAADESPLGEWGAVRIRPAFASALTSQALLANSEEARAALQAHCLIEINVNVCPSRGCCVRVEDLGFEGAPRGRPCNKLAAFVGISI